MSVEWDIVGSKIGFFFAILLVGLIFCSLPLLSYKINKTIRNRILSIVNTFAAGVFLASGFVHLYAEGIEILSEEIDDDIIESLITVLPPVGFVITLFVDKILFNTEHSHSHNEESEPEYDEKWDLKEKSTGSYDHQNGSGKTKATYILIFVLSFHSLLAGIVIGASNELETIIIVFLALISHHWIESFSLGVNVYKQNFVFKKFFTLISIFSIMAPVGIIIGVVIYFIIPEDLQSLFEGILLSITAGSFIYVAIVDILLEELHSNQDKWVKFIVFLIGFILNSSLTIVFEQVFHDHDHSHDSHDHSSSSYDSHDH
eukprot:TRINITY_DN152_c3_g1_i2.p1 TRINITY_DN152_c3_g1~~TRINITY_DN152_c3_g1_i2.p1  ORF type:complete len:316 (+),score=51.91 TRINITY_DN152_c3_g1_i2:68-1015(+)